MAIEVEIVGISSGQESRPPAVILQSKETNQAVVIIIGHAESIALIRELEGHASPRPMTHELFVNGLQAVGVIVTRLIITELRESTFYASLGLMTRTGEVIELDCRPSDGLVIAAKYQAPILIDEKIVREVGLVLQTDEDEITEEEMEEMILEFRSFMQDISPDDFK